MNGFVNFKVSAVCIIVVFVSTLFFSGCQEISQVESGDSLGRQTMCPVMPNTRIDPTLSMMYEGKKVYFCCKGCISKFKANPEKYKKNLPQFDSN